MIFGELQIAHPLVPQTGGIQDKLSFGPALRRPPVPLGLKGDLVGGVFVLQEPGAGEIGGLGQGWNRKHKNEKEKLYDRK